MTSLRVAVIGVGAFGRNHIRAVREIEGVQLAGILDWDEQRARAVAEEVGVPVFADLNALAPQADCAIVATPTLTHEQITGQLLEGGLHVLVEKPIAHTAEAGFRLARLAAEQNRILQVGHLERFNPAVTALQTALTIPLFFEIHRLSVFTPRSLDIDVVLDLMIHDLDIVLSLTGEPPSEIRAAGISVLTPLVDIANARLAFPSGCIANLTASRVSTEKVRKLRLFQPGEYLSIDYGTQDAFRLGVQRDDPKQFRSEKLPVVPGEPLRLELQSFFQSVREGSRPLVPGTAAASALALAQQILDTIEEHSRLVAQRLSRQRA